MHGSSASTRSIGEPSCNMCWSCSSTNKPSTLKFSGKELGRQHQMPSVSSSRGVPSCSTSLAALCSRSSQLFRLYQQANTSLYQLLKQSINQSINQAINQAKVVLCQSTWQSSSGKTGKQQACLHPDGNPPNDIHVLEVGGVLLLLTCMI